MTDTPPSRSTLPDWNATAAAIVAAFRTYFCMYAFRKPFTVATYSDMAPLWGVVFKTVLVVAQVLGYMVSKFVGIASSPRSNRTAACARCSCKSAWPS